MRAASESNPPHIHRTKKPPPGNPAQEAGPSHQVDQPQGAGHFGFWGNLDAPHPGCY